MASEMQGEQVQSNNNIVENDDDQSDGGEMMQAEIAYDDNYNDDSERLQELLEKAGFDKDEIDTINDCYFSKEIHLPKIQALFNDTESLNQFSFTQSPENPSEEIESGIVVFENSTNKYILAKIVADTNAVEEGSENSPNALKNKMLLCFANSEFNNVQRNSQISETIKLGWL